MSTQDRTGGVVDMDGPVPDSDGLARASAGAQTMYVYAVGRDDPTFRRSLSTLTGVDGHSVRPVGADGLLALVSSVPSDVFDEAALRAQMEDLTRLEAIARAHHAVVDTAFTETVVLPLRLATVYLDESRVTAMLTEHRARFTELLAWLDGHVELGVKVYADPDAMTADPAGPVRPAAPSSPVSPGRAYLQQRRQRRRSTEDLYRTAGDIAVDATKVAQGLARAGVTHRPQQGELSDRPGVNLTNQAYLVPAGEVDRFREHVGAVGRNVPGVHVEVTGPWAPYSFAAPDVGRDEGTPG
ncbi:GvpL/GvpF family gas vesicle protein [Streptomyces sp. 24-1644]|uniref:GvpL/GvpF family gas vesicle protein n=1 Tax=Streptomyces sp. 24-1644 TaxID=3457315 RepID=UPI003FA7D3FE